MPLRAASDNRPVVTGVPTFEILLPSPDQGVWISYPPGGRRSVQCRRRLTSSGDATDRSPGWALIGVGETRAHPGPRSDDDTMDAGTVLEGALRGESG